MPPLNANVADLAPTDPALTAYDKEHDVTHTRMLDADAEGADWREVARTVLHIIQTANLIECGGPSIAILPAPNG